jgi:hypothetical protein
MDVESMHGGIQDDTITNRKQNDQTSKQMGVKGAKRNLYPEMTCSDARELKSFAYSLSRSCCVVLCCSRKS